MAAEPERGQVQVFGVRRHHLAGLRGVGGAQRPGSLWPLDGIATSALSSAAAWRC